MEPKTEPEQQFADSACDVITLLSGQLRAIRLRVDELETVVKGGGLRHRRERKKRRQVDKREESGR